MEAQKEITKITIVEGKLEKVIHQEGQGENPQKGQQVFALYRGTLQNGNEFDSNQDRQNPFKFTIGQGQVIKGWDEGFASMKKGQKATLICNPEYAYGARGSPPKIPPNSTLNFDVELLDFQDKIKEKWEHSDEQKIQFGKKFKTSGNDKLKQGDYKGAVSEYQEGVSYLENESNGEAKQILNMLRLNISQAYLKLNKPSEVIENCTSVLKQEDDNLKALYRRGLAYIKVQQFDKSRNDFNQILKIDADNADAKRQLKNINTEIQKQKQKEKKVFGNMFSESLYDDKKVEEQPEVKKTQSESQDESKEGYQKINEEDKKDE